MVVVLASIVVVVVVVAAVLLSVFWGQYLAMWPICLHPSTSGVSLTPSLSFADPR